MNRSLKGISYFLLAIIAIDISLPFSYATMDHGSNPNSDIILEYCTTIFMQDYGLTFDEAQEECIMYYDAATGTNNDFTQSHNLQKYIELIHNDWNKNSLNIQVLGDDYDKYGEQIEKAINIWSSNLKIHSGNQDVWNFNIIEPMTASTTQGSTNEFLRDHDPDIVIELKSDPIRDCNDLADTSIKTVNGRIQKPVHSTIITSCNWEGNEEYLGKNLVQTNVLHEFGHILGLGHAYNIDGDLMCSSDHRMEDQIIPTCIFSDVIVQTPSNIDIEAVLYLYGYNGFELPNYELNEGAVFTVE